NCPFSRSDGAGNATVRNTRGLTRSVMALMVPPLPAASRPSKTTTTRKPLCLTQSCSAHSSTCSLRSAFSYSLRFIGSRPVLIDFLRQPVGLAGRDTQRFSQTPCVVKRDVCPSKHFERIACRLRGHSLQRNVPQYHVASGLAFISKPS